MQEQNDSYSYYSEKTSQGSGHSSDGIFPGLDLEVDFICWLRCVFALPLQLSSQPVFIKEELGKRNQGGNSVVMGQEQIPAGVWFRSATCRHLPTLRNHISKLKWKLFREGT